MKYSVITANYNGYHLMDKYFESLENQTFKDFEVIIIDDCSTDDSYMKLNSYANKSFLDIKILKMNQNKGPGNARNIGLKNAKGEWITFIDNDDWIKETFFEEINNVICTNSVNCIIYDFYLKSKNKQVVSRSMYKGEFGLLDITNCIRYARNHSIGKVYRLKKIKENNIYFPLLRRCEDVAFVARALNACETVYYYKKPLYYYYQRQNSLSNNSQLNANDMIKAFKQIEKDLKSKYPNEIAEKSVTDLLYGTVLMMCKSKEKVKNIKHYIEWYENQYPNWYNLEIISELGLSKRLYLFFIKNRMFICLKTMTFLHSILIN
ncbi:glycosyltransferase family 2 protein [[Eubacterium] hominis]|uniref:glycosyltransferase family 2 protein n=1 Tax=[Eubacterium] hominis TaxID=2764325 RepID=UPI003A4DA277